MGDDFHFNIDIAPDVDASSVRIPSMFIQIMTENSIKHALRNKEGIKLLSITVRREQHNTVIRVTDNGPGFNPATLRRKTGMNIISQHLQPRRTADKGLRGYAESARRSENRVKQTILQSETNNLKPAIKKN